MNGVKNKTWGTLRIVMQSITIYRNEDLKNGTGDDSNNEKVDDDMDSVDG